MRALSILMVLSTLVACAPATPTERPMVVDIRPTRTPTTTPTPAPPATVTRTSTPTPAASPTMTNTPAPTNTKEVCRLEGQSFQDTGYLSLLEGRYNLDAPSYIMAFYRDSPSDRLMVVVPGGNKPSSLYFENEKAKLKDKNGQIIYWQSRGGATIYRTGRKVTITGTYFTWTNRSDPLYVPCGYDVTTIE